MARSHIKQINLVRGSVYLRAPAPFRSFHYHGFQAHGSHPTIWRRIHRLCSSFILIRRLNEDGVAVIVVPERFLESARQISPPRASLFYSATLISPSFCSFVPSVHAGSFKSAASFRGWNIFKMELNGVDKYVDRKEGKQRKNWSIDRSRLGKTFNTKRFVIVGANKRTMYEEFESIFLDKSRFRDPHTFI